MLRLILCSSPSYPPLPICIPSYSHHTLHIYLCYFHVRLKLHPRYTLTFPDTPSSDTRTQISAYTSLPTLTPFLLLLLPGPPAIGTYAFDTCFSCSFSSQRYSHFHLFVSPPTLSHHQHHNTTSAMNCYTNKTTCTNTTTAHPTNFTPSAIHHHHQIPPFTVSRLETGGKRIQG